MKRSLPWILLVAALLLAASYPLSEAVLQNRAWSFAEKQTFQKTPNAIQITGSSLQGDTKSVDPDNLLDKTAAEDVTGAFELRGNDVNLDEQTALVVPGQSATINKAVGFDHAWLKSVEVLSGCTSYDFGLYQDDGFDQGEELLYVAGQLFNYYDGAPPVLRDADGTGEIHAKFWNRGAMGCTFRVIVSGVGF